MAWYRQEDQVNLEDFDPNGDYTSYQLDLYASAMLKEDIKKNGNVNHVLLKDHLASRDRREIKVDATKIDGTITDMLARSDRPVDHSGDNQRMYNRSHPKGRKVNSLAQRRNAGASYYRVIPYLLFFPYNLWHTILKIL